MIPNPRDRRRLLGFDKQAYRERNRVERLINRMQPFRRVATRLEKHATNYLALVTLTMILLWRHRFADRP